MMNCSPSVTSCAIFHASGGSAAARRLTLGLAAKAATTRILKSASRRSKSEEEKDWATLCLFVLGASGKAAGAKNKNPLWVQAPGRPDAHRI
jgi:hypothetical protein